MGPLVAQGFAAFLGTLAMLNVGLLMGWPASSLPKLLHQSSRENDENEIKITVEEASWVVSIMIFAAIVGPLLCNFLVDRIGRKWSLGAVVLAMLTSWIITGLAQTVELIDVGRFIGGLGVGAAFPLTAMYLGEIAEARIRGVLGSTLTIAFISGQVLSFSVGPWISRAMLSLFSALPLVIFLIAFPWLPESPYFCLMKGAREKAAASLMWLRRRSDVEKELSSLEMTVAQEQKNQNQSRVASIFKVRGNRRAFLIGMGLMTFQLLTGTHAITAYAGVIFEDSGLTGWTSWSLLILGVFELVAGICALFVIDLVGRRPLLIASTFLSALFMLIEGVFFHLKDLEYDTSSFSWVPLVGLVGFNFAILPGLGGVTWVLIGEIFPTNVKAFASMFLGMYGSVLGFAVTKLYEPVGSELGIYSVYYFFASVTFVGIFFIYFWVPETKKLTFDDIQKLLDSGSRYNLSEKSIEDTGGK
ncbi:facilitated trehalose transporter Tret1-like [Venturia canescens]|uniref:facilitated trehalose transporter Tret1-like n=1 Tax=Venturia canescens TaxID=32260 RepID=UPI001C9C6164|nr:facilitated trehalose transporter Tret1-like [Venturia canescens]